MHVCVCVFVCVCVCTYTYVHAYAFVFECYIYTYSDCSMYHELHVATHTCVADSYVFYYVTRVFTMSHA